MIAAFGKGDVEGARNINARLLESYDFETSDLTPNPIPAKAMMRALGQPVGQCRLPIGPAPDGPEDRAREVLAKLSCLIPSASPSSAVSARSAATAPHRVDGRILLLDCGLMFPDADMLGIDLVLPDFTYLRENADRIEGCIVTHGHEDHVGGLSFLLRELTFPIYGSALTLGLARNRIEEAGLLGRTELITVVDGERRRIGPFDVEFIPVTHSVPHGFATAFHTPQGVILHTGDFKLDLTPVDGRLTDLARIGRIADEHGIRLLLSDSTNAEEPGHTPSPSAPSARCCTTCSTRTRASASSPPASPATSTACSRSPMPPSPSTAPSPPWACR